MKRLQITHESFQSTCLETRLADLYLTALQKCFQIKHFLGVFIRKTFKRGIYNQLCWQVEKVLCHKFTTA